MLVLAIFGTDNMCIDAYVTNNILYSIYISTQLLVCHFNLVKKIIVISFITIYQIMYLTGVSHKCCNLIGFLAVCLLNSDTCTTSLFLYSNGMLVMNQVVIQNGI